MENVIQPDYIDRRFWRFDPMTGQPLDDKQLQPVGQVQVAEDYYAHVVWTKGVNPVDLDQKFLYTAPPQRGWQGLTDEEIDKLAEAHLDFNWHEGVEEFARAIEAKLKANNG